MDEQADEKTTHRHISITQLGSVVNYSPPLVMNDPKLGDIGQLIQQFGYACTGMLMERMKG